MAMTTHALFVSLNSTICDLRTPHVYLFSDEDRAIAFATTKLTQAGELIYENGAWLSPDRQARYDTATDALDAWQEGLDPSEYLHVYPVTNR